VAVNVKIVDVNWRPEDFNTSFSFGIGDSCQMTGSCQPGLGNLTYESRGRCE